MRERARAPRRCRPAPPGSPHPDRQEGRDHGAKDQEQNEQGEWEADDLGLQEVALERAGRKDEPTGALNGEESEILFNIIRKLNKQGTTIIYISHKMKEVFQISDHITVLRDGKLITTVDAKDTDQELWSR